MISTTICWCSLPTTKQHLAQTIAGGTSRGTEGQFLCGRLSQAHSSQQNTHQLTNHNALPSNHIYSGRCAGGIPVSWELAALHSVVVLRLSITALDDSMRGWPQTYACKSGMLLLALLNDGQQEHHVTPSMYMLSNVCLVLCCGVPNLCMAQACSSHNVIVLCWLTLP